MSMVIHYDPVGTHRAATLGDCAFNHHLAVDVRGIGLHDKLSGFEADTICRLNHSGFDAPDMPAPSGGLVFKPAAVRVQPHAAVQGVRRRCKLAGVNGGQCKRSFEIAAHTQDHHLLIRRRTPPCAGTTGAQRQPVNQLVSSSPTFTRHSQFSRSSSVTVPVRIRLVIRRMISVS